ncbi:hypothetical protein M1N16_08510 [Nitrospinaceae bacterium]|nr:hypothetical protein [Nitrospinaceae bacterium]
MGTRWLHGSDYFHDHMDDIYRTCDIKRHAINLLVSRFIDKDNTMKEKTPLIDHIGSFIGIVVIGFILFILAWPIIDPTPNKSSTLKENARHLTK